MLKMRSILTCAMLCAVGGAGAGDLLLSDNNRSGWASNTFDRAEPRLTTGATLKAVSEGERACSPEFLKTAAQPDNTFRALLDGRRGPEGNCQGFSNWDAAQSTETFVIDLKKPFALTRAAVWAQFNATCGSGAVEVLTSADGVTFTPAATGEFPKESVSAEKLAARLELTFTVPVTAQYVEFRVKRQTGKHQQVIAEAAVWGNAPGTAATGTIATPAAALPPVELKKPVNELLLSDNPAGNALPADTGRLATGATLSWITEGEFATTSEEMLKTGSRPDGNNRVLLDGARGTDGNCQAFGNWGKQYYGSFIIDLKDHYLITRASIWSQQTKTQGFESMEILLSADGKKFISVGSVNCPAELLNATEKMAERVDLKLEKPAMARYIQFRVKKHPARMQMILSEAAVWGDRLPTGTDSAALLPENQRPEVKVTGTGIGSGALKLDWKNFASASQVKNYRVYRAAQPFCAITEPGVAKIGDFSGKQTAMTVYPLTPGETGYYGVTAVYSDGEYPVTAPFAYTPPGPIDYRVFGDMLAVNHFWGGGGARHTPRTRDWEHVALDLLADTPFKEIRWWESHPEIIQKLYERGIGATTFSGERNYRNAKELGIHLFGSGNEPHLQGVSPEKHAERVKKSTAEARAANPANRVYAPTVCLDRHSMEYLDKFYAAGAKPDFDILDVHTYLGNTADFSYPEGYPSGSPEGLFGRIAKVREIMAKYGDADKPMISTEYGFTDCNVANPVGHMTPELKAAFLIRGLIIHNVLGFKRVFVYSFWDEGEDRNYTEHFFGLVDYRLQKKPAYFAIQTLGRELGRTVYDAPMKGADTVNFGYVYKNPETGKFVTVVWNGGSEMSGRFRTAPGSVGIVGIDGARQTVKTAPDGSFRTRYGFAPIYLESDAPVELIDKVKVEKTTDATAVALTVPAPITVVRPGEAPGLEFSLANPTRETLQVLVSLEDAAGKTVTGKTIELPPGATRTESFPLPAATAGKILERFQVAINYEGKYSTFSDRVAIFVRRLAEKNGIHKARMHGYQNEVYLLVDDALEITVDPMRGGRILEIFDRRTGRNQITVTYERLGGLDNIAFYYCIWDQVKAPRGLAISRNAPCQVEVLPDGLRLRAGAADKLELIKTLRLDGNGVFRQNTELVNHTAVPVKCSYYMHPEYTVGGSADSHADTLILPIGGKEEELPFWTGLGDRPTPDFSAGYWILRDPAANYQIRQEFSLAEFRKPRIWFGIGCCNFEMESRSDLEIPAGGHWTGDLKWIFSQFPDTK